MQKTRNNLLRAAAWLAVVFIVLRTIYRIYYSVRQFKVAGSSDLQNIKSEIIIGFCFYVLPAILAAFGLFVMKRRGLVIVGLAIQTGLTLLQLALKFYTWMFPRTDSSEQILAYKKGFLTGIDDALWSLALLLLIVGLFRMIRKAHPQTPGADSPTADAPSAPSPAKPNVPLRFAACAMALYLIYCIVCIVIIVRQGENQTLLERFSLSQLTTGIIIPVVSAVLLTVGLYAGKPAPIAIGLAVKAGSYALFVLKYLILLFRGDSGYIDPVLSNLSFLAWNFMFVLLALGLYKMIRSQAASPVPEPAGAAANEESPADE